ncbi:VCBS repeat-containing protein [Haloimpatiens sp. FM7315]|uniref:VCBS repeat-containing protein n=1 Tax=Haloimpatiens sp. FM7315 TaxID=3298609 RepID=UPI0035A2AF05
MKLKIVILKRKYFYFTLMIFLVILLCLFILNFKNKISISTFNIMSKDKILKTDLTGDAKEDYLYIKTEKQKYYLQLNTNYGKSLFLEPIKKLGTLGYYYKYWPMRLNLKDINMDNIPEIFIQSSQNNKPIQHVFKWHINEFKDIYCSNNNILGFIDFTNNKNPKLISGNFDKGEFNLNNYILIGNNLKKFDYKYKKDYIGKDSMGNFIKFTENLSQNLKSKKDTIDKFTVKSNNLPISKFLFEINERVCDLSFQDAFFKDSKYDEKGNATEITWILNFKGRSNEDKDLRNYTFSLLLNKSENKNKNLKYKISKISLLEVK